MLERLSQTCVASASVVCFMGEEGGGGGGGGGGRRRRRRREEEEEREKEGGREGPKLMAEKRRPLSNSFLGLSDAHSKVLRRFHHIISLTLARLKWSLYCCTC